MTARWRHARRLAAACGTAGALLLALAGPASAAEQQPAAAPVPAVASSPPAAAPALPPYVPAVPPPSFRALPPGTGQVVRALPTRRWCPQVYCAQLEAWQRGPRGYWWRAAIAGRGYAVRAQTGPRGFGEYGVKREGSGHTPTGIYAMVTTFSTGPNPGTRMRWRQRLATSVVSGQAGPLYNTWIEQPGRRDGARPSMRYGLWTSYNNSRMVPGVGAAPLPGFGSGIFVHSTSPTRPYAPTAGCVASDPANLAWLLRWLRPVYRPRILLDR